MSLSAFFRRPLLLALPVAVLAFSGCGKDDEPAPQPQPDQGKVSFVNAAASAGATVGVKFMVNNVDKATLNYGQAASGYQSVGVGVPVFKTTVASSGQSIVEEAGTVAKDVSYSYFLYNITPTVYGGLLTTDNLTAPATGKAKIRLVHLGNGIATSLNLSTTLPVGYTDIVSGVAFGSASNYIEVNPGTFTLAITTGSTMTPLAGMTVGDGTGTGAGATTLVAGKIYTVLVRGVESNLDTNLKAKVVMYANN